MQEKARREELEGVDRATRDRHQRETTQKKLDMGKRLTAGVWAGTGYHCIDTECMAILHRQSEKQKQKELDKVQKEAESKNKLLSQVRAVVSSEKLPDQLTLEEWTCPRLKVMCMYYNIRTTRLCQVARTSCFNDTLTRAIVDHSMKCSH
jgi:hypothetical protein